MENSTSKLSGKLELVASLYEAGFLCKCKRLEIIVDEFGIPHNSIQHEDNCEGRMKATLLVTETE